MLTEIILEEFITENKNATKFKMIIAKQLKLLLRPYSDTDISEMELALKQCKEIKTFIGLNVIRDKKTTHCTYKYEVEDINKNIYLVDIYFDERVKLMNVRIHQVYNPKTTNIPNNIVSHFLAEAHEQAHLGYFGKYTVDKNVMKFEPYKPNNRIPGDSKSMENFKEAEDDIISSLQTLAKKYKGLRADGVKLIYEGEKSYDGINPENILDV